MSAGSINPGQEGIRLGNVDTTPTFYPAIPLFNEAYSPKVRAEFHPKSGADNSHITFQLPRNRNEIKINLTDELSARLEKMNINEQTRVVTHLVQQVSNTLSNAKELNFDRVRELQASLNNNEVKFTATVITYDKGITVRIMRFINKLFNMDTTKGLTSTDLELKSLTLFDNLAKNKIANATAESAARILGIQNQNGKLAIEALLNAKGADKEKVLLEHAPHLQAAGVNAKLVQSNGKIKVILEKEVYLGSGAFKVCRAAIKFSGKDIGKYKAKATFHAVPNNLDGFVHDVQRSVYYSKLLQVNSNLRHLFAKYKDVSYKNPESNKLHAALTSALANSGDLQKNIHLLQPVQQSQHSRDLIAAGDYLESQGIAHRDLKLSNLLIANGRVVVSDYGLMTDNTQLSEKTTFTRPGTPRYLPPPAPGVTQRDYTLKQDNFSMGLILLEIATKGKFRTRSVFDEVNRCTDAKKINQVRARLAKLSDNPMARIIVGLLDPDPEKRLKFSDAKMQIDAIDNADLNRCHAAIAKAFSG